MHLGNVCKYLRNKVNMCYSFPPSIFSNFLHLLLKHSKIMKHLFYHGQLKKEFCVPELFMHIVKIFQLFVVSSTRYQVPILSMYIFKLFVLSWSNLSEMFSDYSQLRKSDKHSCITKIITN